MLCRSGGIYSTCGVSLRDIVAPGMSKRFPGASRPRVTAPRALVDEQIDYQGLSRAEPVYLVSTQEMVSPVTDLLSSTRRSVLFLGRSMG